MKKYDQTSEGSISLSLYSIENMEIGSENMDNSNISEVSEEFVARGRIRNIDNRNKDTFGMKYAGIYR
jgi:hypothetical protein